MITKVRVKNFKAIQDSGEIELNDLSIIIGNNGSGKSSVLEALELVRSIVLSGLSASFEKYGGLEKVRNYKAKLDTPKKIKSDSGMDEFESYYEPISIELSGHINKERYSYHIAINTSANNDYYFIQEESLIFAGEKIFTLKLLESKGGGFLYRGELEEPEPGIISGNERYVQCIYSVLEFEERVEGSKQDKFREYIVNWNFLHIDPQTTGSIKTLGRSPKRPKMDFHGSNLGELISFLYNNDKPKYEKIIHKMKLILPYLSDINPKIVDSFDRKISLIMQENESINNEGIPSWLFSSGTIRILALLTAIISINPESPSIIFVDEIENGLDPQTLALLFETIKELNENKSQAIVTTHSISLLNQIDPKASVLLAKRELNGSLRYIKADSNGALGDLIKGGKKIGDAYSEYSPASKGYKKGDYTID